MSLAQRFRNLVVIPSYHYHPIFAQEVQRTLRTFKPTAIALEVSQLWAKEFEWGASCWPCPMASFARQTFAPIVPGDSMVEAFRLGRQSGIPIFFIDLELADPIQREASLTRLDPAFAPRVGNLFIDTLDALDTAAAAPARGDIAREAFMARHLCDLIEKFDRVVWVGGMAHWGRIRHRMEQNHFDSAGLARARRPKSFLRMRLEWSALHRFTQRLPFQVAQFTRQPDRYSDSKCFSKLALAAVKPGRIQAVEVASMLVYARNLAAMNGIRETPGLWELLTASSSVLGNEYASRLASVALRDHFTEATEQYPLLTHNVERDADGKVVGIFRCDGKALAGRPLWDYSPISIYRKLPSLVEIRRRLKNDPAAEVKPAKPDAKKGWAAYPDDEKSYEAFVRYALEHVADIDETTPVPLTSGISEGIDVRATIRHWGKGDIYVREPSRPPIRVTNGLIDWTSSTENSWILQNNSALVAGSAYHDVATRGWIDPSLTGVGSASWEVRHHTVLQTTPFWIQQDHREVSLITLDTPTWIRGKSGSRKSFYDVVILGLLELKKTPEKNNIYGWLETMFTFCRNKPFAYYSHYKPSQRIVNIGQKFGVRVIHVPLNRIPQQMLKQHQSFKFMNMTRDQWEELLTKISEYKRAWTASEITQ